LKKLNGFNFSGCYQHLHFFNQKLVDDFAVIEEDGNCRLWSQMTTEKYAKAWLSLEIRLAEIYDADPTEMYMVMKKEDDDLIGTKCWVVSTSGIVEFDDGTHLWG
jgi:hypothetical protein